ncbi:MAG TPA: hypothetical protein PKC27_04205, partial [Methanomethylovorans sp.]|nr:hypothetical protein [Methanomethylovorans sp.]
MISGVSTAAEINMDFVSRFGGGITGVAVSGNYAYLGQGQDIVVMDITNDADPTKVATYTTTFTVSQLTLAQ